MTAQDECNRRARIAFAVLRKRRAALTGVSLARSLNEVVLGWRYNLALA